MSEQQQPSVNVLRASAKDAASAMVSLLKGLAFYDADHPVVRQQRRDAEAAVRIWQISAGGDTFVAAAGKNLVLTGLEDNVSNLAEQGLCDLMIEKAVVGFKLKSPVDIKQLDALLSAIGEPERRVRAAGGVGKILAGRYARDIEVFEIDLDELMAGATVDPVGLEPIFADALTAVLALKQNENRLGEAVALTLERVDSPESLGSLLDEMIDGAAPETKDPEEKIKTGKGTAGGSGTLSGMNAEDLAELASEAYGKVASTTTKDPEALAEAADVLSSSLVRLSPDARFQLLQKIAATQNQEAAEAVGKKVPNSILLGAIAQVVMGGERDSKLASAIGGLLERMRPLERDRQKLLDELDDVVREKGRPLDGVFTQELNEISQNKVFGSLDLPFRETKEGLIEAAHRRRHSLGQPEIVHQTFVAGEADTRIRRTSALLARMLDEERTVTPATLASVRSTLTLTGADSSLADAGGQIMLALWGRGLRDGRTSAAAKVLADIAASPNGADWCVLLVENLRHMRGKDTAQLLCDYLKSALAAHPTEGAKTGRLGAALTWLDRSVLREMENRVAEFTPPGVNAIISASGREGAASALRAVVKALKADNIDVKIAALRALSPFSNDQVLEFLRRASGADGDGPSVQVLYAQRDGGSLDRLQRAAVEALGATRNPDAVPALAELLNRTRVIGGANYDRTRAWAAQALSANGTAAARNVLTKGRASRNRSIRSACEAAR
jgi:hypothetical protein